MSLFTFETQLSAFGKFIKVFCSALNCRGNQLTIFACGTQFVLGLNLFWDSIVSSPKSSSSPVLTLNLSFPYCMSIEQGTKLRNGDIFEITNKNPPSRSTAMTEVNSPEVESVRSSDVSSQLAENSESN